MSKYPAWVCSECAIGAIERGKRGYVYSDHVATFHVGKCGVCGQEKSVTKPRDYGFPIFEVK